MNRFLLLSIVAIFFVACGANENSKTSGEMTGEAATEAPVEIEAVPEEAVVSEPNKKATDTDLIPIDLNITTLTIAEKDKISAEDLEKVTQLIRKEYARIEVLVKTDKITLKELNFECPDDPQGGSFKFYFSEGNLVKAVKSFYMGDHAGGESAYYFQGNQFFFGFHEISSWTFAASESDTDQPQTRDDYSEQRDYYYQGKLVNQLFKDYSQLSSKEKVSVNKIPNRSEGKGVPYTHSGAQVISWSKEEALSCDML